MIRHEIMTKRTRAEIEKLAEEMCREWRAAGVNDWSMARARNLIFNCLHGAREDYQKEAEANG